MLRNQLYMYHDETAGQSTNIVVTNRYFEKVPKFKYLKMTAVNKNLFLLKCDQFMLSKYLLLFGSDNFILFA
jgi:hypothetical protein